jgi:hypothetical protein
MGCYIHAHIEVKIDGAWHHYSCPPIQRDYRLFERICGVRGDIAAAIAPPRGLPADLSLVTAECYAYEKANAHSMTWLSGVELDELIFWMEVHHDLSFQHEQIGYLTGNTFTGSGHPASITDARLVCWFDN